jgi:acetyl-CoA synthetase
MRLLGSVGEPINPEAWMWYRDVIGGGRCPIVDTWWQTETGAMMISPLPSVTACKPGSAMRALPGIGADGRRRQRKVVGPVAAATSCSASRGRRCCAASGATRSATRTPTGAGWPQYYFAGDGAKLDEDGAIWLLGPRGRRDERVGHRISTTEVESALVSHPRSPRPPWSARPTRPQGRASWPS